MSPKEVTRYIPEHSNLTSAYDSVRGLGAVEIAPVCTAGVENVLCYNNDQHAYEDILLRELAHGIHLLGARLLWKNFQKNLERAYTIAMASDKWKDTYASHSVDSYFVSNCMIDI